MQSELLAHINGLFTGRTRRKSELPEPVGIDSSDKTSGIRFRRKSETQSPVASNGGRFAKAEASESRYSGLNLVRVAKLNLKRLSIGEDVPPKLPARHFSTDSDEELPPPIPERVCSLEMVVDAEFQGRFSFRPISTVPLPEQFQGCKKTYPSKAPKKKGLQRPPSEPPPPPPPPPDSSPSPTPTLPSSQPVFFHTPPTSVAPPQGGRGKDSLADPEGTGTVWATTPRLEDADSLTASIVKDLGWSDKDWPLGNGHTAQQMDSAGVGNGNKDNEDGVIHGSFSILPQNGTSRPSTTTQRQDSWSFLLEGKEKQSDVVTGKDDSTKAVMKPPPPSQGKPVITAGKPKLPAKCQNRAPAAVTSKGGSVENSRLEDTGSHPPTGRGPISPPVTQTKPVLARLTSFTTDPEAPVLPALGKQQPPSPAGSIRRHVERAINPAMHAPQVPAHAQSIYQDNKKTDGKTSHVNGSVPRTLGNEPKGNDRLSRSSKDTDNQHQQQQNHHSNHHHDHALPPPLPPRPALPSLSKAAIVPKLPKPSHGLAMVTPEPPPKPTAINGIKSHFATVGKAILSNGPLAHDLADTPPPPPPPPPPPSPPSLSQTATDIAPLRTSSPRPTSPPLPPPPISPTNTLPLPLAQQSHGSNPLLSSPPPPLPPPPPPPQDKPLPPPPSLPLSPLDHNSPSLSSHFQQPSSLEIPEISHSPQSVIMPDPLPFLHHTSSSSSQGHYNTQLPTSPSKPSPSSPPVTVLTNNGWGGQEIFDPREEEGDPYDKVDMTLKFCSGF